MDYTENAKMYLIVLKNISKGTPVQAEAEVLISDFEKNIKKQGLNSAVYWGNRARKDLHDLLTNKIKEMLSLQSQLTGTILNNS
ncbi:hypothetical protein [Flavobacterium sp. GNP002]